MALRPMDLCPEEFKDSSDCKVRFCQYRNKKGLCSIDITVLPKEYEVEDIANILQISRQRVWRIVDTAIAKLQNTAGKRDDL